MDRASTASYVHSQSIRNDDKGNTVSGISSPCPANPESCFVKNKGELRETKSLTSTSITATHPVTSLSPSPQQESECLTVDQLIETTKILQSTGRLTPDMGRAILQYLEVLDCVAKGNIPEKYRLPGDFSLRASAKGLTPEELLNNEEFLNGLIEATTENPVAYIMVQAYLTMHDELGICNIFSKEFAQNLYACISPLSSNLIELGCGRAMLTAAIREIKSENPECKKGTLLATDKEEQTRLFKGVSSDNKTFWKKTAAQVTENYKKSYMNVIYLTSAMPPDVLKGLINQKNPLFLVHIGPLSPEIRSQFAEQQLRSVGLGIQGLDSILEERDLYIQLLALNMPEGEFRKKEAMIPARFKMAS
ncbi:hypothetical protein [Endozoicomonas atrinae]|uniref:hypothetical protein n=1 Tax=Endozoicomonas atrinae TaxID=1333660 RepID=UPI003AFFDFE7